MLSNVAEEAFANFSQHYSTENVLQTPFGHSFDLKFDKSISPNHVLSELAKVGEIHQFSEIIPSMNDIFLEAVQQSNH